MAPDGPDELLAEVQAGQHRVGTLGNADSEEFRAIFAAGETQGRAVVGEAARTRGPNGHWALQVCAPAPAGTCRPRTAARTIRPAVPRLRRAASRDGTQIAS